MGLQEHIRDKGLKATPVRLKVMEVLQSGHLAYSHTELESTFNKVDRITLYRALKDLDEAGLVHKIIDRDGITRFAVCKHNCPDTTHTEEHVHFNCITCHKMICLEKVHVPAPVLPPGFRITGTQTIIHGTCDLCK